MAQVKFFKFDSDGFPIEHDTAADDVTFNSIILTGGTLAMGSAKITGLADGTASTDAATYGQLQSLSAGFDRKESCRVKHDTAATSFTASGSGVGKTLTAPTNASSYNTVDGVLLSVSDRVLVDNEASDADNGIYTVTALGNDTDTSFTLTRATDADQDAEVTAGMFTFVTEGTNYADTGWFITTDDPITVDTTTIAFSQFAGVGAFTGGDGIDITSGVISVDLATNPGLEFSSGQLTVKDYWGITLDANGISVDPDTETGGNIQGVNLTANGVGLDVSAIAGTGVEADGSANLRLATQGNGIAGGGGTTLSVQPDSTTGGNVIPVDVTANGVGLDVDDLDGDGLAADGSGRLEIELSALSGLEMAGTSPNETLQANVDGVTIQINGSGELEVIGAGDSQRTSFSGPNMDTGQTAAKGDPLFYSAANALTKCDAANNNTRKYVGVAKDAQAVGGGAVYVQQDGIVTAAGSGWTPGGIVYLAAGGGLTQTVVTTSTYHRMVIGKAKNATDLVIEPQYLGKNA